MEPERLNDFQVTRRLRVFNRITQIGLSIILILGLNFLASKHYKRYDLTKDKRYSLSAESKAYLEKLEAPINIFVTIANDSESAELNRIRNDLGKLLAEYEVQSMRSGEPFIRIEYVDTLRQRKRTQELVQKYNIEKENVIVVATEDQTRTIELPELYEAEEGKWHSFRGENSITSAIIEVSSEEMPVLYFTLGHGEMRINEVDPLRGLSLAQSFLQERGFTLKELDLTRVNSVPEDAGLVFALAPQAAFSAEETEKLRRYMSDRNGRMILTLEPGRKHGLEDLLFDWGILVEDHVAVDVDPNYRSQEGDLIIRHFSEHPISKLLFDYGATAFFGQSRPIRIDPASTADDNLALRYIIGTSQKSWAERDYRTESPITFTPERDLSGPLSLAVASNRSTRSGLGLSISGGRLICYGNSDFLANNRFQAYGNYTLFINSVNWALDRNAYLNIPTQPLDSFQLIMSQSDLKRMLLYFSMMPLAIGLLGILIYILRRR